MKVHVKDVINSIPILKQLMATKLPFALSYKVKKIVDQCNYVGTEFDKGRVELLQQFATLDKEKNEYRFDPEKPENLKKFNERINEIFNSEVDVEINPLTIVELDIPGLVIEPSAIELIEWMIAA